MEQRGKLYLVGWEKMTVICWFRVVYISQIYKTSVLLLFVKRCWWVEKRINLWKKASSYSISGCLVGTKTIYLLAQKNCHRSFKAWDFTKLKLSGIPQRPIIIVSEKESFQELKKMLNRWAATVEHLPFRDFPSINLCIQESSFWSLESSDGKSIVCKK